MTQTHGGKHYKKRNNHRSNASGGGSKAGHDGTATSLGIHSYELQLTSFLRTEHDTKITPPILQTFTDFDEIIRDAEKRTKKYYDNQFCNYKTKAFIRQ